MEKQELLDALGEHGKAIEQKQAEIKAAVENAKAESKAEVEKLKSDLAAMEETKKTMQKQLDELDIEIQKVKKGGPSESVKTFAAELKEQLTKEAANFLKMKGFGKEALKEMQIEMKSFLESANASITTGSLLPQPQFEVGVSKAPDRMPFLMEIISSGVANSFVIHWVQRKTRTNNGGFVTEGTLTKVGGGSVSESVLGYETKNATMQNFTNFIKVSNNSIDDIEWLMSEIQTELLTLAVLDMDAAILNGTVAANGFDGLLTKATAFSAAGDTLPAGVAPNKFDALAFALAQVKIANHNPNYVVLHPADLRDLKLTRDDSGSYMLPPTMAVGNNVSIDGVRVISNTGMTKGSYLVGDFTKAKFWTRKGMEIRIWEQNEDDAKNQLKTITLYTRGTMVVKDADTTAFVTDTFADTITEITLV